MDSRQVERRRHGQMTPPFAIEAEDVQRALRHLSPRLRAALVLRFSQGLSERDVAAVLGCQQATAHSLVCQGIRGVRQVLGRRRGARDIACAVPRPLGSRPQRP